MVWMASTSMASGQESRKDLYSAGSAQTQGGGWKESYIFAYRGTWHLCSFAAVLSELLALFGTLTHDVSGVLSYPGKVKSIEMSSVNHQQALPCNVLLSAS